MFDLSDNPLYGDVFKTSKKDEKKNNSTEKVDTFVEQVESNSPYKTLVDAYGGIEKLPEAFKPVKGVTQPFNLINAIGAGRRLRSIKDAETLRDAQNILLPTVRKFAEQAKRDEFARDMAGAGIKQNILTNAALTENMQRAGLNMGLTAAQQAGNALTARYNY